MSDATQLQSLVAQIDELISHQKFAAAADCTARLAAWVRSAVGGRTQHEIGTLAAESLRAIETARRKICVSRTRITERLLRLDRTAEYCVPHAASVHTWTVEG